MNNKDILNKVELLKAARTMMEYCNSMKGHCGNCMFFNVCGEVIIRYWDEYLPKLKEVKK